ncbi:17212_t:CDS:1, partial [Cetraspora pellucida]
MIIWMKKNYQFSIDPKTKFPSFVSTLFNWRINGITIPYETNYQKYIDSITVKDLNLKMINHLIKAITKFVIRDLLKEYLKYNKPEIPERSYILRVLDYFITGHPFTETYTFFYCFLWSIFIILSFSLVWDNACILFGIILRPLLSNSLKENEKLQESKSLKMIIKEWLILSLFYTKPLMGNPFLSIDPRDFWSNQWHQIYSETFHELGYFPVRTYFKHNKTLGRVLGICSVYLISGLFHDYTLIVAFNHFSADYTTFFLFHGLLLILWEVIEGRILGKRKDIKD